MSAVGTLAMRPPSSTGTVSGGALPDSCCAGVLSSAVALASVASSLTLAFTDDVQPILALSFDFSLSSLALRSLFCDRPLLHGRRSAGDLQNRGCVA